METLKVYELLQDYINPCGTIHKGVVKTEEEWMKDFPHLNKGECEIKIDWFKKRDFEYTTEEFFQRVLHSCETSGGAVAVVGNRFKIEHIVKLYFGMQKYLQHIRTNYSLASDRSSALTRSQQWWDNVVNNRVLLKDKQIMREHLSFLFEL